MNRLIRLQVVVDPGERNPQPESSKFHLDLLVKELISQIRGQYPGAVKKACLCVIVLSNVQLQTLQCSILKAGIRFRMRNSRALHLQITCADDMTSDWLEEASERLQLCQVLPRSHICFKYISDDVNGKQLLSELVLTRLRKVNHERVIPHQKDSGPGKTYYPLNYDHLKWGKETAEWSRCERETMTNTGIEFCPNRER